MATVHDFDIFDCHHHVGDVRSFMPHMGDEDAPTEGAALAAERAERVRIMDAGGVRQAAVIPGHAYSRTNGISDTRDINTRIALTARMGLTHAHNERMTDAMVGISVY